MGSSPRTMDSGLALLAILVVALVAAFGEFAWAPFWRRWTERRELQALCQHFDAVDVTPSWDKSTHPLMHCAVCGKQWTDLSKTRD